MKFSFVIITKEMCHKIVLYPLGMFLLTLGVTWPLLFFLWEPDQNVINLIVAFMLSLCMGGVAATVTFLVYVKMCQHGLIVEFETYSEEFLIF